jgi:hypothetical protein
MTLILYSRKCGNAVNAYCEDSFDDIYPLAPEEVIVYMIPRTDFPFHVRKYFFCGGGGTTHYEAASTKYKQ